MYWSCSLQSTVKLRRLSSAAFCSNSTSRLLNRFSDALGVVTTRTETRRRVAPLARSFCPICLREQRVPSEIHSSTGLASFPSIVTQQIFEGGFVMRHEVVNDGSPVDDAHVVHLEEAGVEQQVERLFAPRLARVLIAAQTRQHLRTRAETRDVVRAARRRENLCSEHNFYRHRTKKSVRDETNRTTGPYATKTLPHEWLLQMYSGTQGLKSIVDFRVLALLPNDTRELC